MITLHPDDRCNCARKRPTGSWHFGLEKCLCGRLIVRSKAENARLDEMDAERRAAEKEYDLKEKEAAARRAASRNGGAR